MIQNELLSVDNGKDKEVNADATLVAKEYYTSYAKYVLEYRALPSVYDGLKPVQRRIIYTANQFPQKLMKTAKLSGAVLQYHPHGSSSVTGSIDDMAHPLNVFPMFVTKGNFGGVGFGAAADRYTECYLSEVARKNYCQFIDYADYEVGEIGEEEPSALPCLIPYCMMRGSEGIGVGLSTKIMPLNLIDLIDFYIDYIKNDGHTSKFIKPDVGYVLLEMDESDIRSSVENYKGWITVSSLVTQISSNTLLVEGVYFQSIDSVLNKIDKKKKWFTNDQVGYRNASTSSEKYVFEIYDTANVSISDLKTAIVNATWRSGSYCRTLEEDGNAVYSSLHYNVKKSLECLNKAIDKKIVCELNKYQNQLDLYKVLDYCKQNHVFDNVTQMNQDQLVDLIVRTSNCSYELANEIVKKPISYLTKSHDKEAVDLQNAIDELNNHDRKKYLIKLYKDFRKLVLPYYEEKKHTITRSMIISDPRVKFTSSEDIQVTDGDGIEFKDKVYFIGEFGTIYPRTISTTSASSLIIETWNGEKIIGVVSDKDRYVEITTKFVYDGWKGKAVIDLGSVDKDRRSVSLRTEEDQQETVESFRGIERLSKYDKPYLKGDRVSKTTYVKI